MEEHTRATMKRAPHFGQDNPVPGTIEQAQAEFAFEVSNGGEYCRMRSMQFGGGSLEATLRNYRVKASQLVECEAIHIVGPLYRDRTYFVISMSIVGG